MFIVGKANWKAESNEATWHTGHRREVWGVVLLNKKFSLHTAYKYIKMMVTLAQLIKVRLLLKNQKIISSELVIVLIS
jgi:hypothetical protein